MPIWAVRTTLGREASVMEGIAQAARKFSHPIFSLLLPKEVKGYVLIEAESMGTIRAAIRGVNHARGIVEKPVGMKEVEHFLEAKPAEIKMKKGDTVEMVSDPFRGEKAKIIRVDPTKREVTVEMAEAAIPIPMTVPIEAVRLIKSSDE
ncbi:MAG: transcription elongation factor Spt5 [Candidatus Altiarchaeota archaeon]|nr:transcription elongation factor Spt5 [Candidatus Altiarchaeota archaeon]